MEGPRCANGSVTHKYTESKTQGPVFHDSMPGFLFPVSQQSVTLAERVKITRQRQPRITGDEVAPNGTASVHAKSVTFPPYSFADDVPPYFKTEPVRSQLHLERNRLVLTCMAEGSWPLEFKWIHNSTELTRFSLEYRYLIPSLDRSHAGFYRCIVRNRVGALLQRRTEVQVAFMGSFEEGERAQSVSQGEGAVIPAPRIRSFPQPQVTWFRDGRKIPPSSRM
ncbi:unnamed protein product [Menidia menidia]|uniref:(Atlantic silverside) hypothetical protein n=1 Tax=Menidia menidia TaxID=238744 RepID=A0A8S4B7A4_9TELE|nr:unnamed protein product [Menidia menidia]